MPDWLANIVVTIAVIWLAIDFFVFFQVQRKSSSINTQPKTQSGADTPHSNTP